MSFFTRTNRICGLKKGGGFTLVEMLVVITIVGVLATISIGAYSQYRRASLLEIAADNFISTLYKARDEVSMGKVSVGRTVDGGTSDGVNTATCRGIDVKNIGVENFDLKILTTKFNSQKKFNGDEWIDVGCDTSSEGIVDSKSMSFENDVDVLEVKPLVASEAFILFSPPNGEIISKGLGEDVAKITLGYSADADQKRVVIIDLKTGLAHVKTP